MGCLDVWFWQSRRCVSEWSFQRFVSLENRGWSRMTMSCLLTIKSRNKNMYNGSGSEDVNLWCLFSNLPWGTQQFYFFKFTQFLIHFHAILILEEWTFFLVIYFVPVVLNICPIALNICAVKSPTSIVHSSTHTSCLHYEVGCWWCSHLNVIWSVGLAEREKKSTEIWPIYSRALVYFSRLSTGHGIGVLV